MAATYYAEDNLELQVLTKEYVSELTEIWSRIFNREMCQNNVDKLKEHARKFYKDLVTESLEREQEIWKEIEELKHEAETLSRLLKTDINLPCYNTADKPLLDVQSEMDQSLMELRECLRQRREQIYELLLEQEALCEELGESPRPLPADPLPTQADIDEFRAHLECLREERVRRMNKLSTMRREIRNFLNILETKVANDMEDRLLNVRDLKLNEDTFTALEKMHKRYGELVQEVHDGIEVIRKKLDTLWDRLAASPATRNKFRKYTEYTHRTYDALYGELQRCEALKSQNIKLFVQQIRNEIREWWDKTLKSQAQRNSFTNFNSTCYTDDLLELHEMELEDLKLYYEANKEIFDLYADRRILWERMIALDAKASEPGRYNNRGGQLLREEKERKTLASKLPKIEKQITELVMKYESRENAPFLVNGENILEVMAEEWEQRRQEKEQLTSARKHQGLTPGPKASNSALRTPMSLKNASSVSLMRKTPSTTSLSSVRMPMSTSSKRKLAPTEKCNPAAKRSLMYSPSVTGKLKNGVVGTPSSLKSSILKPPMKRTPHRVIATTIRRCSGRLSAGAKKRRSMDKSNKFKVPKILVCQSNEDENEIASSSRNCLDDTYDSFEPAGRSSMLETGATDAARKKRLREKLAAGIADQHARDQNQFSKKRMLTPSKPKMHGVSFQNQPTASAHPPYSPSSISVLSSGRRKLTTKNLPIII